MDPSTSSSLIKLEVNGRRGTLTLNRPNEDNRLTDDMMLSLRDRLREAASTVDFLVLQGAGPHFCVGRDRAGGSGMSRDDSLALAMDVNHALMDFSGLVIAAIRGKAIGFGSGLAVQSDLAIAGASALLGFDEISHGFPPMIVMSYLGRYLLPKHVHELILVGTHLTAAEAKRVGLINDVVPDRELDRAVDALVGHLQTLDVSALKSAKQYLRDIADVDPGQRAEFALRSQIQWFSGRDG